MLAPNTPISVTLTQDEWRQVIGILREAPLPHRVTDPAIREIDRQCVAADQPETPPLAVVDNVTPLHEAGC
jgi:hypothetical protein